MLNYYPKMRSVNDRAFQKRQASLEGCSIFHSFSSFWHYWGCIWTYMESKPLVWVIWSKSGSVQSLSWAQPFTTPWTTACQASLSINSWSLLKLKSIESLMPSNHLIFCCPLILLPSIFPSIRVFSDESALRIKWPKDWSFSFSISPSSDHSGLISFRMDRLDLLAVQGTLKSLLQHHSSKASILQHSAFFTWRLEKS